MTDDDAHTSQSRPAAKGMSPGLVRGLAESYLRSAQTMMRPRHLLGIATLFAIDRLERSGSDTVRLKAIVKEFRAWQVEQSDLPVHAPQDTKEITEAIRMLCETTWCAIEGKGDQRVVRGFRLRDRP